METITSYIEYLRNVLNEGSLTEWRSFIRSFVKEVIVKDSGVTLEYRFPMLKSGQQEENLGVLSAVHYGRPECTIDRTFSLSFRLAR